MVGSKDGVRQVRLSRTLILCLSGDGGTVAGGTVAESLTGCRNMRKRHASRTHCYSIDNDLIRREGGG